MGEAAKRLSLEFREAHPNVPWREMAGLRDVLVHDYEVVDPDVLWEIVKGRLPGLKEQIEQILSRIDS